jgi:hypothetical protein
MRESNTMGTGRKKFSYQILVLLSLSVVLSPLTSFAGGERANVAVVSLGRVGVASSRGLEAIGTNPANLTLPHRGNISAATLTSVTHDTLVLSSDSLSTTLLSITHDSLIAVNYSPPTVSFQIAPFGLGFNIGTDLINFDIYEEYFTGIPDINGDGKRDPRYLDDNDKERILEIFRSGIAETHIDMDIRIFGLTFHNDFLGEIGVTMTDRISANFDLPKDYARFALYGLDSLGSAYDLSGTSVKAWYLREYALSYARNFQKVSILKNVAAGISFKLIHGYAAVITQYYNGTFGNTVLPNGSYSLDGNLNFSVTRSVSDNFSNGGALSPFPKPAGNGFGVDLGAAADVYQGVRAAVSITDVGAVNWTANTKETYASASFSFRNPAFSSEADSLEKLFKGYETTYGEFSTSLAAASRIGVAVQVDQLPFFTSFPGQLMIAVEYHQGFNSSPGNTTRARLGIGMEYRPIVWLPLRSGISIGGQDRFNWAAGFGFDFGGFNLNVGTENIGILTSPSAYNQVSLGIGMLFRIN